MSFFGKIHDLLNHITKAIAHIFTPERIDKALDVAAHVSDLIVYAAPYVEMLAAATPTPLDDILVKAAEKLNMSVHDILSDPDPATRKGRILTLVGEAARLKIEQILGQAHTIKIGSIEITVPADIGKIAGHLFDLAAQAAYSLYVRQTTEVAPATPSA